MRSSAPESIASRTGAAKIRCVDVGELRRQVRVDEGDVVIERVEGEKNVAALSTKHVDRKRLGVLGRESSAA